MKPKLKTDGSAVRQQITQSLQASFRLEGIVISPAQAAKALEKVEATLGKASK